MGQAAETNSAERRDKNWQPRGPKTVPRDARLACAMPRANPRPEHRPTSPKRAKGRASAPLEEPAKISHKARRSGGRATIAGESSRPHRWARINGLRGATKHRMGQAAATNSAEWWDKNWQARGPKTIPRDARLACAMPRANAKPAHRPSSPERAKEWASAPLEEPAKISHNSPMTGGQSHHRRKNPPTLAGGTAGAVGPPEGRGGPRPGPWQPAGKPQRRATGPQARAGPGRVGVSPYNRQN